LILEDSMASHLDDNIQKELSEMDVDTYELIAHSSHLTQPLDGTIFSKWKREMKKPFHSTLKLTDRSIEIYIAIKSFESVTGFF